MADQEVTGLVLTVGGNKPGEGGIKVPEDEWLPAVLKGFTPFQNKWGMQLRWIYELEGETYTWVNKEKNEKGQLRVWGQTSQAFSPKSNLYKIYVKLTGREPAEGEKVDLNSLVPMKVFIMVKVTKGKDKEGNAKDWYKVDKVKPRAELGAASAPVAEAKPAPSPVPAPIPAEKPAPQVQVSVQQSPAAKVTKPAEVVVAPAAAAEQKATGDLFNDIFP